MQVPLESWTRLLFGNGLGTKGVLSCQDLAAGEVDHFLCSCEQRPIRELLLHLGDLPVGVVVVPCGERGSSDDVVH